MLVITNQVQIPETEIQISAIRAQGPGGQNVNKVASAIHLRFDINKSSLPDEVQSRLLKSNDYRITRLGVVVIKAQRYRTREQNLEDARERLKKLVLSALQEKKQRKRTRPTAASKKRRLHEKTRRGVIKKLRTKISADE